MALSPDAGGEGGFTLIELIVLMMVLGIMAFVALPRMDFVGGFDARGQGDQIEAWLRFAQKSALAQRRMIALDLSTLPNTPILRYSATTSCGTSGATMAGPPGWTTPKTTPTITNNLGTLVCFDAMGSPHTGAGKLAAQKTIVFADGGGAVKTIQLEPETGYVHSTP